jgi:hypothetical protein
METLHCAMTRLDLEARPLMTGAARVGTPAERAAACPAARVALRAHRSSRGATGALALRLPAAAAPLPQRLLRADPLQWFPELAGAPASTIEAPKRTSFESWERLRFDRQLGIKAASAVVEGSILSLLRGVVRKPAKRTAHR